MGANNSSLGFVGAPLQQLSFWYYKKVRLTLSLAVKYGHACALHDLVLARYYSWLNYYYIVRDCNYWGMYRQIYRKIKLKPYLAFFLEFRTKLIHLQ